MGRLLSSFLQECFSGEVGVGRLPVSSLLLQEGKRGRSELWEGSIRRSSGGLGLAT